MVGWLGFFWGGGGFLLVCLGFCFSFFADSFTLLFRSTSLKIRGDFVYGNMLGVLESDSHTL